MQIVCPNCNARYLAPDAQIGLEGRRVRCGRCANVWWVEANETPAVISAAAVPASPAIEVGLPPEASSAAPIKVDPIPRNRALATGVKASNQRGIAGWIAFLAILIAILSALYFGRETIMRIWPASTVLYNKAGLVGGMEGLSIKTPALEVSDLANEWVENADGLELVLHGKVTNRSLEIKDAPFLRLRLYDHDNSIVRDKRQALEGGPIQPGEARAFSMSFQEPGDVARALPALE